MKKKIILDSNSSWKEIREAQEIVSFQAEINNHIDLCKAHGQTKKEIDDQLQFMYGNKYQEVLNIEIIAD